MLKYRSYAPIVLLLLYSQLFVQLVFPFIFGWPTSKTGLFGSVILGLLAGTWVSRKWISWVIRNQSDGKVYLSVWSRGPYWPIIFLLVFLGILAIVGLVEHGSLPELHTLLGIDDPKILKNLVLTFVQTSLVVVFTSEYIWGLRYEKMTGHPLIYTIRF